MGQELKCTQPHVEWSCSVLRKMVPCPPSFLQRVFFRLGPVGPTSLLESRTKAQPHRTTPLFDQGCQVRGPEGPRGRTHVPLRLGLSMKR